MSLWKEALLDFFAIVDMARCLYRMFVAIRSLLSNLNPTSTTWHKLVIDIFTISIPATILRRCSGVVLEPDCQHDNSSPVVQTGACNWGTVNTSGVIQESAKLCLHAEEQSTHWLSTLSKLEPASWGTINTLALQTGACKLSNNQHIGSATVNSWIFFRLINSHWSES